jgi:hypothetical protein
MAKSVDDMCVHTLVQQARKKTHKEITSLGGTVWGAPSLRKEKDVLERACQQTSASFTRKHVLDVLKKQRDAGTPFEQWVFPKMQEICQSEASVSDALMGCLQSVSESTHVQHMDVVLLRPKILNVCVENCLKRKDCWVKCPLKAMWM